LPKAIPQLPQSGNFTGAANFTGETNFTHEVNFTSATPWFVRLGKKREDIWEIM